MIKFNLSKSTLYYLKRNKETVYSEAITKKNINKDMYGLSKNEMDKNLEYINPPKTHITIKSIQSMLN